MLTLERLSVVTSPIPDCSVGIESECQVPGIQDLTRPYDLKLIFDLPKVRERHRQKRDRATRSLDPTVYTRVGVLTEVKGGWLFFAEFRPSGGI